MTRQDRLTQAMQRLAAMDRRKVIHVISDRNRWVVMRERAKRATRILADREQAIDLARSLAREANGEVIVHRKDGTMQEWQVVRDGRLQTMYSHGDSSSPEGEMVVEPKPTNRPVIVGELDRRTLHRPQGPDSGVNALIGKWPGSESDEEIIALLEELS